MKIAVLSGKGGTGKTLVSASMALSIHPSVYADCDVEEPNGYIFLNPEISSAAPVNVKVPQIDTTRCKACGDCARACMFSAIAVVKGKVLFFPELCHHCGACAIACKEKAIVETDRTVGTVEHNSEMTFFQGRLNVGEPVSVPVIRALKKHIDDSVKSGTQSGPIILDCPPGASCSVVNAVDGCDYCILVTEPTPFGLHDCRIAAQLVKGMGLRSGIVINKAMTRDDNSEIYDYCKKNGLTVLMEIPYSEKIARSYSSGVLPVQDDKAMESEFRELYARIRLDAERSDAG